MFEYIKFDQEKGDNKEKDVVLLALSTCGFCKRAIAFLKKNRIAFRRVYIDKLDPEIKQQLKDDFQKKFHFKMIYPLLILDEKETVTGFTTEKYKNSFGITDTEEE